MDKNTLEIILTIQDLATQQLGKVSANFDNTVKTMGKSAEFLGDKFQHIGTGMLAIGAAPAAALVYATTIANDFEDQLADVGKTTGATGKELEKIGEDVLRLGKNTRTSIPDLVKIAEIGGQLGIKSKDIKEFTQAIDVFNVALGGDFSGGVEMATSKVGKLISQFKETKNLDVATAIRNTGSAINYLGAEGTATSENVAEFATRLGQLPATLRPSIQDTLALGALFEEVGLTAEISSGGLTNFFLVAGKELDGFAKQMGITTETAQKLLNTNPTEFVTKFSQSIKDLDSRELAVLLDDLKIGTQESIKVIGALGSQTERFKYLQSGTNKEFALGTSLLNEYNTKNSTTVAELSKLNNNLYIVGQTIGNEVKSRLDSLLVTMGPFIQRIIEFAENNKGLVATLLIVGGVIAVLGTVLLGVGIIIASFGAILTGVTAIAGFFSLSIMALLGWIAIIPIAIAAVIAVGWLLYSNWDMIGNWFKQLWTDMMTWLGYNILIMLMTIDQFISGTIAWFTNLKVTISVLWNALLEYLKQMIISFTIDALIRIATFVADVVMWFENMRTKAYNSIIAMKNNVVSGVVSLWNAVVAEVSSWPGKMYDWGVKMIQSFIDGIKSMVNAIGQTIKSMLDSAKGMLEGKSPPKEGPFKEIDTWGMNVGQAWVDGFRSSLSGLASVMPSNLSLENNLSHGISPGSGSSSTNNYQQPISIYAPINTEVDIDRMAWKLGYALRNS